MSDDVIWVPFEDSIRERLQFDLDEIRGITSHMPRDTIAMDDGQRQHRVPDFASPSRTEQP